jgi:toxin-antitoxin system PIN domain toxin
MILVDANLLMYAANRSAPEHEAARAWLDEQLSGTARVGLAWPSLLAFVRLASNPLVVRQPVSPEKAWKQAAEWLSAEAAWIPLPTDRHAAVVAGYFQEPWMTSRLVPDAHLAGLAVEHGLTLCSTDGDFARFSGLTWLNPLAARS